MTIQADAVIVGAGPCGLFQVFELGLLGIKAHLVESLEKPGGQCTELYPDKPIYDIPAIPVCGAQELVERLMEQIEPFEPTFHLDQTVTVVERRPDDSFYVETSAGTQFETKNVIIAAGVGAFQPMPLRVAGMEQFIDSQMFYRVKDPKAHHGKDLVILGGGDSALDWVLELVEEANSLTMVHRSTKFRAAPASVQRMRELEEDGRLRFIEGVVQDFTTEGETLQSLDIKYIREERTETLPLDHLLVFFGLSPKLGPIADWGIELQKNQLPVNTETFETNIPGIFAIGDINTYPGKKKLILSGFHEGALAAFAIKARMNPDEKVHLQYTTTSPIMHKRLKVEGK